MIRNQYTVTWALYRTWVWENMCKPPKLIFLLLWCALALIALVCFFVDAPSPFYLLFALFFAYRAFLRDDLAAKKQYAQLAKMNGGENWLRTITFTDDSLLLCEGAFTVTIDPAEVTDIREKGDKIWLMLSSNTVVRLYQTAFTAGSWPEAKAWLSRHRG